MACGRGPRADDGSIVGGGGQGRRRVLRSRPMRQFSYVLMVAVALTIIDPQAQEDYPHAFPREGVTKLVDNDRVNVWEVNWITGAKQPIHRHRHDMAGVYLRYGPITVTRPDGTANPPSAPFEIPRPYFQAKDVTHREEALNPPGTAERLAIMVDLKYEPGAALPTLTADSKMSKSFPRTGAKNVLENDRVRMWDFTWERGRPVVQHLHDTDTIEVFLEGGVIASTTNEGKTMQHTVAWKSARFVPRGTVDTEVATSGSPRAVIIELK